MPTDHIEDIKSRLRDINARLQPEDRLTKDERTTLCERGARYADKFGKEILHCPGLLSKEKGYWILPALEKKISLATGAVFDLKSPEPTDDLLSIWIAVKETPFRQSVRAFRSWIEKKENEVPTPIEQKSNYWSDREYRYELKYVFFKAVFFGGDRTDTKHRRSAHKFCRWIKDVVGEQALKDEFPELSSPGELRKLLKLWEQDCPVFFTVRECSRPEKNEYIFNIAISDIQDPKDFLGSRYQRWIDAGLEG